MSLTPKFSRAALRRQLQRIVRVHSITHVARFGHGARLIALADARDRQDEGSVGRMVGKKLKHEAVQPGRVKAAIVLPSQA